MRLLTASEQRALDAAAVAAGLPVRVLMESAGEAVARAVLARAMVSSPAGRIAVFCGPGNNGGDGYAAARFLREALATAPGAEERVLCVATVPRERLRGEALGAAQAWEASGGATRSVAEFAGARDRFTWLGAGDAVVDAVFGSGLVRPPVDAEASAIASLNEARARGARLIAVDVPSGVDADLGAVHPAHIAQADLTVTFHLPKRGLYLHPGAACAGEILVAPIGLPRALERQLEGPLCELLEERWALELLTPRRRTAHKYDFGSVLAIAGSQGRSGAAALLCEGALRAGAGLVTLAARPLVLGRVQPQLPEVMGAPLPASAEEPDAPLSLADLPALREALRGKTALAIGPGIARGPETAALIGELLAGLDPGCASVLDADALNALAGHREQIAAWCSRPAQRPVLTPHAGELARLVGETVEQLESDRVEAAVRTARRFSCAVVFKGAPTVIAEPEGQSALCAAGNPGMATAGSGDVLTGVIAALLARRDGPGSTAERAQLAVLLHALAGDAVARETGEAGLIASDLARRGLPLVFRRLGR